MRTDRRTLTVVAVVLASGAAACSGAPTARTQALSPSAFTGHIVCGPPVRTETSTQAGDHQEFRGGAWTPRAAEMTEPRLDGDYTISESRDVYDAPGPATHELSSGTWRIETPDGAWQGSSTAVGFPDGSYSLVTTPLVGEGAYDGLVAFWEARFLGNATCAWDIRGVIFPAGPPEPPTAP